MELEITTRFSALSHPHRLSIFRLLMRRCPDALAAGEIARVLGYKASTTSVYLSALSDAGLIVKERHGTSLKYQAHLSVARRLVSEVFLECCNGRPDLCPPEFSHGGPAAFGTDRRATVLFICTGNSARSLIAEALLRHEAHNRFEALSAGAHPKASANPHALEILRRHGVNTETLYPKSVPDVRSAQSDRFDFVFTLCDHAANEDCPRWDGAPISSHWGIPEHSSLSDAQDEPGRAFQTTFDALSARIKAFTALPVETLDRVTLQTRVDSIAKETLSP